MHQKRLYAIELGELVDAAKRGEGKELKVAGVSAVVGSPIAASYVGTDLVLASTNVRTLVKLGPTWRSPQELSLVQALGSGDADLRYGALVPLDAAHIAVSVAYRNRVGVVVVDVPSFSITRAKVFEDRFAGYPAMCGTDGGGRLFLVSTGFVDVLESGSLNRAATVPTPDWAPTAVTCVGQQAWVSDNSTPAGRMIDGSGRQVGAFSWAGASSSYLRYSKELGRVFGTDQSSGVVFACALTGGTCQTSRSVGAKPTDLLIEGPYVLVTVENGNAVAVLRADDLGIEGLTAFPGQPRTMTLMHR